MGVSTYESNKRIAEIRERDRVHNLDCQWFAANPHRYLHCRVASPAEYGSDPPPGKEFYTIVRRDSYHWEIFYESPDFNVTNLNDTQLRTILRDIEEFQLEQLREKCRRRAGK